MEDEHLKEIGHKILKWYDINARDLPWRKNKNPYNIWISEIILQQTRVKQGLGHYVRFIEKFPDIATLANANINEVLLYWKGLGYYSRAINLHKAAKQIQEDFNGVFPKKHEDILKLKGIGKYTASAISSISFNKKKPAVDGNFYRVLSRIFADDYDISQNKAQQYFGEIALKIMPDKRFGDFNQAIMDLGSGICKPQKPACMECPLEKDCLAFSTEKYLDFPVKTKKIKIQNLTLNYFFIYYDDKFLIKQRDESFIWKKLYDFPEDTEKDLVKNTVQEIHIGHKLSHKNLLINISIIKLSSEKNLQKTALKNGLLMVNYEESLDKSFPKPLTQFLFNFFEK